MQTVQGLRKTAKCPFCGSFLCTGVLGESIQIVCHEKGCKRIIDINFTEKGVQMTEAQTSRESPQLRVANQ